MEIMCNLLILSTFISRPYELYLDQLYSLVRNDFFDIPAAFDCLQCWRFTLAPCRSSRLTANQNKDVHELWFSLITKKLLDNLTVLDMCFFTLHTSPSSSSSWVAIFVILLAVTSAISDTLKTFRRICNNVYLAVNLRLMKNSDCRLWYENFLKTGKF